MAISAALYSLGAREIGTYTTGLAIEDAIDKGAIPSGAIFVTQWNSHEDASFGKIAQVFICKSAFDPHRSQSFHFFLPSLTNKIYFPTICYFGNGGNEEVRVFEPGANPSKKQRVLTTFFSFIFSKRNVVALRQYLPLNEEEYFGCFQEEVLTTFKNETGMVDIPQSLLNGMKLFKKLYPQLSLRRARL